MVHAHYGIKEIEHLNFSIIMLRSQKIQIGNVIRIIKHQDYEKLSEDLRELDTLKKMHPFYEELKADLERFRERKNEMN